LSIHREAVMCYENWTAFIMVQKYTHAEEN
jgi:hypothetical protein